ncbi:hypothetical protein GCM10027321_18440 [Massilia terrae]|uniref:Lipoprotein n=1 Tax=Massilia terrae TaxID=1811224 RepID=A0ABT2CWF4_9BURK|nr:hypothetical protein [Massilia terrae]MCS0658305.1 hypothetical protein [Massilia terrae]
MTTSRLLTTLALACALVACQKQEAPKPVAPPAAPVAKEPTREEAMASLMEVPELKTMSEQIEKKSQGKTHGAVIEDDPQPRMVDGKPYWQFSFVENAPDAVHRRASFLVAKSGKEILVDDTQTGKLLTVPEWRRTVRRIEAH